jgi:hypothetical protein
MIINATVAALLRPAPVLSTEWQEKLCQWLKVILQLDFQKVFPLQFEMLDTMVAVEEEIRAIGTTLGELKQLIRKFKEGRDLPNIIKTQKEVTGIEDHIRCLRYQRETILFLGDVMALKMLDQDTIKHFGGNPAPGFISGKEGLKAEKEAAHHFFEQGYMVLFNDLSHSLRIGDLTLRKEEEVRTFEVKTSAQEYFTKEAFRQISLPIIIHDYMKNDVTAVPLAIPEGKLKEIGFNEGPRAPAYAIQLESDIVEDLHFDLAGSIFKPVWRNELVELKRGAKTYLACAKRNVAALRTRLEFLTAEGDWIATNVRDRVLNNEDIPPFGLYFKPQSAVDLITGEIIVITAFSMQEMAAQFKEKKIAVTWKSNNSDTFPIEYKPEYELEQKIQTRNTCQWHLLRVLYSFLGLETFVARVAEMLSPETLARFSAKSKEIDEKRRPNQHGYPRTNRND